MPGTGKSIAGKQKTYYSYHVKQSTSDAELIKQNNGPSNYDQRHNMIRPERTNESQGQPSAGGGGAPQASGYP